MKRNFLFLILKNFLSSYISGMGTPQKFLIFHEMELSDTKINKFCVLPDMEHCTF